MDVFAVGVLLHEMVTGRRPRRALRRRCRRRSSASSHARHRADPAQRYASAAEMRARPGARLGAAGEPADDCCRRSATGCARWRCVQTLATAVALWAFLLSVTPQVLSPGDVQPLIMLRTERLPDGRVLSRARFETWPTLAALAAIAVAVAAQALLRRHWRDAGLERPRPDQPVRESRTVLRLRHPVAVSVYGLRLLLEDRGFAWAFAYIPILGRRDRDRRRVPLLDGGPAGLARVAPAAPRVAALGRRRSLGPGAARACDPRRLSYRLRDRASLTSPRNLRYAPPLYGLDRR